MVKFDRFSTISFEERVELVKAIPEVDEVIIQKDLMNKAQSHINGIQNQLLAWRGSLPISEGSVLSPTPKGGEA